MAVRCNNQDRGRNGGSNERDLAAGLKKADKTAHQQQHDVNPENRIGAHVAVVNSNLGLPRRTQKSPPQRVQTTRTVGGQLPLVSRLRTSPASHSAKTSN